MTCIRSFASIAFAGVAPAAMAQTEPTLGVVTVEASRTSQLDSAPTAGTGLVTREQLAARSVYRPGELLEATPGLVVSQHSGEGKANQFFLRGFNLDHGTDLRTTVDGMLVNQRSHAHGQGWTDLNFLIPELVGLLEYRKGPFHAGDGDFASAGAVQVGLLDRLDDGIASIALGQNGYRRTLLAGSPAAGAGRLLYALELLHHDGPFTVPDDFRKVNSVLRYSQGSPADGFNLTAMAYRGRWHATDQIPRRAVTAGTLGRFDAVDPTDGGSAQRYSVSGAWRRSTAAGFTTADAYVVSQRLQLYSNFTYFLSDPVRGDQFAQPDRRVTTGVHASHTRSTPFAGFDSETTVGVQLQLDRIHNALQSTVARELVATVRQDRIVEDSAAVHGETTTRWTPWFRTVAGARVDAYRFRVRSDRPENSGRARDWLLSPKLNLVFGPWARTELYSGVGRGFHSNDARGTTTTIDPATGAPVARVTPLVRTRAAEFGVRTEFVPGLQSTLSIYRIDIDSELLFVGDAGTTEAARASRRIGFEFANHYRPARWLTLDGTVAYANARYRQSDAAGDRIPGAVEGVASLAAMVDRLGPWSGALQMRWFGPRPLVADNSVRSDATTTLNARVGYRIGANTKVELEVFNLTGSRTSAIDYYYPSRLRGESAPVADTHFHPIEPRSFRWTLTHRY